MFLQEQQTAKQQQKILEQKRQYNELINQKLNSHYQHLPTMSEVQTASKVSNNFENTKHISLSLVRDNSLEFFTCNIVNSAPKIFLRTCPFASFSTSSHVAFSTEVIPNKKANDCEEKNKTKSVRKILI